MQDEYEQLLEMREQELLDRLNELTVKPIGEFDKNILPGEKELLAENDTALFRAISKENRIMQKFKYEDGSDGIIYETLKELLQLSNIEIMEYGNDYYVTVKREKPYYSIIYKVEKQTGKASYHHDFIGYMLDIAEKATPVDPEVLRRVS